MELDKNQLVIGLSGKIGAGKNTVANFMLEVAPMFVELAFAVNVKKVVALLTGTSLEDNMDREKRKRRIEAFNATLGELQQKVGNGMRTAVGKNVWIEAVLSSPHPFKIITDVRFPDEVEAIKAVGGIVVRIERSTEHTHRHDKSGEFVNDMRPRDDISETALDNYNFEHVIVNDGNLEDLKRKSLAIMITVHDQH